jgi:rod shape-determining protein MreC
LLFFSVLSFAVMVADVRFHHLDAIRQTLATVLHPLQEVISSPIHLFERISGFFVTQVRLQNENLDLKKQALQRSVELQRYHALQTENIYLRQLLDARSALAQDAVMAEVVSIMGDPFTQRLVVDKGSSKGIQGGQPVVDDIGVVGQVTKVFPLSSEVTLLTDQSQAVPVQVRRNSLRAVVFGHGQDGMLDLPYQPVSVDIQAGDELVTSGIDGVYPPGLPVAVVAKVERAADSTFAKIACRPSAGVNRHRQILILHSRDRSAPSSRVIQGEGSAATPPSEKRCLQHVQP